MSLPRCGSGRWVVRQGEKQTCFTGIIPTTPVHVHDRALLNPLLLQRPQTRLLGNGLSWCDIDRPPLTVAHRPRPSFPVRAFGKKDWYLLETSHGLFVLHPCRFKRALSPKGKKQTKQTKQAISFPPKHPERFCSLASQSRCLVNRSMPWHQSRRSERPGQTHPPPPASPAWTKTTRRRNERNRGNSLFASKQ